MTRLACVILHYVTQVDMSFINVTSQILHVLEKVLDLDSCLMAWLDGYFDKLNLLLAVALYAVIPLKLYTHTPSASDLASCGAPPDPHQPIEQFDRAERVCSNRLSRMMASYGSSIRELHVLSYR